MLRIPAGPAALALALAGCERDPGALSPEEAQAARIHFQSYCAACHEPDGRAMGGGAPPLAGSPWVLKSESRLVRIVLHGLRGPIEVDGKTYNLEMPGFGQVLTDAEIAGLLSYVRGRYGGSTAPISAAAVSRIRAQTRDRAEYWTARELLEEP